MIVIGVDPGTQVTGFGIIGVEGVRQYVALDYGCIRPPPSMKLSDRYHTIYKGMLALLERYHPDALAVETQYVSRNPQSALKLGMARGVIVIAAKEKMIPVYEYTPSKAKKAVVGHGKASKQQVQGMMQMLLNLPHTPEPEDAADALALALCHIQASQSSWKTITEM